MEKLHAGISFLYRDGGYNSTVFEVRLKTRVRGDCLQRALTTAITRYPYLAQKLVERNGDFYLEQDFNGMVARPSAKLNRLGSMATGYHLIDVTFTGNNVRVAFHHALCDGRGIKPFVETLLYYYFCFVDNKTYDHTGIRLAGEPLLENETADTFNLGYFPVKEPVSVPEVERYGFHLIENDTSDGDFKAEINFDNAAFVAYAKAHGATPSILLALMLAESIANVHPDFLIPIVAQLAFDTRRALDLENTHHNSVSTINLAYTGHLRSLPLEDRAKAFRKSLDEQREPNYVRSIVNAQIKALSAIENIHSLKERLEKLDFFNHLCPDTFNISYIGLFVLKEYDEKISSVHLYSSGTPGLRANMCSAGKVMSVDLIQSFSSSVYYDAFLNVAENTGIPFTAIPLTPFETPKDKAQITAGHQAERLIIKRLKQSV